MATTITLQVVPKDRKALDYLKELDTEAKKLQKPVSLNVDVSSAKKTFGTLGDMVKNFQSTMRSRISTAIIGTVVNSTKEALTTMKAVDQQLTNIQKVSGKTSAEIQKIGDSAYSTASKFGVAADKYLEAVYTFQKAGIGEKSEEMAELATKTMLVGDTSAAVASKFLIATNAAWDLQGNMARLTEVVDEADYINNNYATSLDKLSAGMPIVASTAANMNMTIEETLAVLGTITAKTQESGTKAATAWRALSMNLAKEVGTITDEEGEAIEVTEDSIKSVTDALKKYGGASIQAAIDSGKVIKPIEAVKALAEAYKDGLLDDIELTNILMNVGGKLRTNQLTTLVKDLASDTSTYYDIMSKLPKAAGTADAEINTMLGSWNAKTQQLKNTWAEFVSNLIDSGLAKDAVDLLKGFVSLMDSAVGRTTAATGALAILGSAFGPVGAGIGALAGIALNLYSIWRDNNREFEAATEALDKMNETFEEQNKALKENDDKLEVTGRTVRAYIDKLDSLDRGSKEYHDTLERIVELMPELKQYIDLENDTIVKGKDYLKERADAWVESARMAAYAANLEAKQTAVANAEIAKGEAELKASRAKTELSVAEAREREEENRYKRILFEQQQANLKGDQALWDRLEELRKESEGELETRHNATEDAQHTFDALTSAVEEYDAALKVANEELEIFQELYDKQQEKVAESEKGSAREEILKKLGEGGAVDLTNRPLISGQMLIDKGWAQAQAEDIVSVFAQTFKNKEGDLALNFTPVVVDEYGQFLDVLTPEQLKKYAEDVIAGVRDDDLKIQIGGEFKGKDAFKQAESAANGIKIATEEAAENMSAAAEEAEEYSNIIWMSQPASEDKSQRVKPDDLGESAGKTEENAARITQAVGDIPPAYDAAQKEINDAQDQMVSDAESFVEDTASAIEREAATAAGAAASAGTTIGLSFAKAIDQSDAVITGIANMVGAAKQFMASLGGSFSIHPSGANYYLERGTGKQIFYNQQAGGTTNAPGGPTLVNELGPELINDNGRVYIANGGKPAVVNLSKGSIVLTAEQTKGALAGANRVPKYGAALGYDKALADLGYGYRANTVALNQALALTHDNSAINNALLALSASSDGKTQTNGRGRGGGGSSTPGKTAAQIAKEAAEKRKKELEAAQKKLDDSLSNLDKQIKLALNQGDEKKAAQLYEKQQQLIADMVKKYQKAGYKDTSNEILDLLNKNYDIAGKQESLYKDKFDDLIDSLDANTDAEKKANTLAEKAQAVSDAQEALANAQKQRTVRIYNAATGQWEWIADEKQVKSAEENLKKAEQSYADEVKSQALEELKSMRDTISNLNDIVLGPALSTVATMGSDTSEFQAFAQALHAVYGVGSYLVGTQGSSKVLPTNDSHDTVYSFGDLVLTEEQASTMTLKQLAQQLQVLKLTS